MMERIRTAAGFLMGFLAKMRRDQIRAHSAEAAFFIIISVFPALMVLLTMLQFTPVEQEQILYTLEAVSPVSVRSFVEPLLTSIYSQSTALVSWSLLGAVWAAGKSIFGLTDGLNSIYRLEETRNYIMMRIRAACYTVLLLIAFVISLVILVFGYRLRNYILEHVPLLSWLPDLGTVLPVLLAMGILVLLFSALYVFLPNQRMRWLSQIPGAVFASVTWTAFSSAFSVYMDLAGNMSVLYGSLTTLVVVLLWLYACMYLLFVGAEINHYLTAPELFPPVWPWERFLRKHG